jgi:peroxiredoxin
MSKVVFRNRALARRATMISWLASIPLLWAVSISQSLAQTEPAEPPVVPEQATPSPAPSTSAGSSIVTQDAQSAAPSVGEPNIETPPQTPEFTQSTSQSASSSSSAALAEAPAVSSSNSSSSASAVAPLAPAPVTVRVAPRGAPKIVPTVVEAPDFALRTLENRNLRLSEFRGEVVLINFWASWCGACRQAMPSLNDMYGKYHRAGLIMLSVNVSDDLHRAAGMAKSLKIPFPVLLDEDREVSKSFRIEQMPTTLLIDRAGIVRHRYVGYNINDEQKTLAGVRELLNE